MEQELHHALMVIEQRVLDCNKAVEDAQGTTSRNLSRIVRNQQTIADAIQRIHQRLDQLELRKG